MISETPRPRNVAAGISIQYHQVQPPGLYLPMRPETTIKAMHIIKCLMPSSRLGSRRRFRRDQRSRPSFAGAVGNCPLSACGIRLMFAPHERQKLAPSTFCVAHLGQNIFPGSPIAAPARWSTAMAPVLKRLAPEACFIFESRLARFFAGAALRKE